MAVRTETSWMMDNLIEIIVRGKGSKISSDFCEPIIIPSELYTAQIGLKNFTKFNNIPNIVKDRNNQLKIKVPGDKEWHVFTLETGAYELKVIAEQMVEWITVRFPKLKVVPLAAEASRMGILPRNLLSNDEKTWVFA